jgi:cytochrome c oxidase cbb3-type subunit 3
MTNKKLIFAAIIVAACHRETRNITPSAVSASRGFRVRAVLTNPYEGNSYAMNEGQRLFEQYNCAGCHAHGGGGIGPALMDKEWTYGSSAAQIYASICSGRPNGMPSWCGRIPDFQIWELVTYVRSLGGFESQVATPARADEMQAKTAEE